MFNLASYSAQYENLYTFTGAVQTVDINSLPETIWYTWTVPKSIRFVNIVCIGGGGSGAANSGALALPYARGGQSGGVMVASYVADFLPDVLYISPGYGGKANTNSNTLRSQHGTPSLVCVTPDTSDTTIRLAYARGGYGAYRFQPNTTGTSTFTDYGITGAVMMGNFRSIFPIPTGNAAFKSSGFGSGIPISTYINIYQDFEYSNIVTPGGESGGTNASGYSNPGNDSFFTMKPISGSGGRGSSTSAAALYPGNGSYGSGGGGSGSTTVSGGNGGPGLVMISCV